MYVLERVRTYGVPPADLKKNPPKRVWEKLTLI